MNIVENKPIVKKASQEIDDPDEIDLSEVVNKNESSNKDNSEDIKNKENIVKENVANGDEDVNANELKVLDELLYQQTSTPQHQQQSQQRINLKALAYIRILRYFTVIFITLYAINQSSNLPWHESFSALASINPDFKISDLPAIDFFVSIYSLIFLIFIIKLSNIASVDDIVINSNCVLFFNVLLFPSIINFIT